MKLSSLIIGLIFACVFILGGVSFIKGIAFNYGQDIDLSRYDKTMQRLNQTEHAGREAYEHLQEIKFKDTDEVSLLAIPYHAFMGAVKVVKVILTSLFTVEALASETASGLAEEGVALPSWFVPAIIVALFVVAVIIVVQAVLKFPLKH